MVPIDLTTDGYKNLEILMCLRVECLVKCQSGVDPVHYIGCVHCILTYAHFTRGTGSLE